MMKYLPTLLFIFTSQAFEFAGKVVGVSDGDTLTVLYEGNKQYKVRLQHIDCPETAQPFATKAKQALSAKVFGKVVTIKFEEMDRYKRILGDVYVEKQWVNLELVKEGMAWHYKYYSNDTTMAEAELKAKSGKLGIWSMPNPTPPWDFRRGKGVAVIEVGQPDTAVFVSRTGAKYHREDCRFVSKSRQPTTLQRALGKYTACGVCGPPLLKVVAKPSDAEMKKKVFVTRTGGTYHRDGCHFLAKSKIETALGLARQKYRPCSKCAPPK